MKTEMIIRELLDRIQEISTVLGKANQEAYEEIRTLEKKIYSLENSANAVQTHVYFEPRDMREFILAVEAGNKIQTIKHVRSMTGIGLKEAKDLVESTSKTMKPAPVPAY